jgi:predicted ABC-type ATPase
VIGGPNGAGKTSAAPDLLRDTMDIDAFVNADVIAQGLAGFDPESAAFEAGRIMLTRIRELAGERADLAVESTLSGRSTAGLLRELLSIGYDVRIFYLWLPSPDYSVARVRRRVESGGHDVPEPVIRRRFWKSLRNFDRTYRALATSWRLYDSSVVGKRPLIAHGSTGEPMVIVDQKMWSQIRLQIEEIK